MRMIDLGAVLVGSVIAYGLLMMLGDTLERILEKWRG